MPIHEDTPRRDYEEAFRSLGRRFDEQGLEDVLLVERESGFLATGLRRAGSRLLPADPQDRYEYTESAIADADILAASVQGAKRRGTRHRADRNELSLRLIGRHVNEARGSRVVVIDQGHRFLLRMLMRADTDMPHRFATITTEELERMREVALSARKGEPAPAQSA